MSTAQHREMSRSIFIAVSEAGGLDEGRLAGKGVVAAPPELDSGADLPLRGFAGRFGR
ncbi:hypothetical protein [Mycobacterium sp.]|uniref:hypothetical protein n=1 Tax=Mycobacterium sp. TaxID=1785 RepID=UPI003D0EDDFB